MHHTNISNAPAEAIAFYKKAEKARIFSEKEKYYKKAMELGHLEACVALGSLYEKAPVGTYPVEGILEIYEKAVEREIREHPRYASHCYAGYHIGMMYYNGRPDLPQNYEKAFGYFMNSACPESYDSYWMLTEMYLNGLGVARNVRKADDYIKLYLENDCLGLEDNPCSLMMVETIMSALKEEELLTSEVPATSEAGDISS